MLAHLTNFEYLCALEKQVKSMAGQKTPTALGTENIGKLLMQYAVPAIIAMTASSLYNMVDSIFIGHGVGTMAISGLALTFPLMNLAAAFGSLVGVGAATLISVKLGQKDYDTAQRVLGNVFVLNILLGVAFTVVVMAFLDPILYFFGGSDETVGYARDYMQIILLGNAITHLYLGLNAVLRSSGHPQKAMYATIATVVINTILDPVFIYGFGWGIRGAAVSTILAQVISLIWQLRIFSDKDELLHFHRGIFRLKRKIVFDSLAIGAFGIVNRLVFIVVMIVMGLNQGMQPIAGYNFGAGQYSRVTKTLKLTIIYATGVTTFGFVAGMLFSDLVVSIFTSDAELIALSAKGLRIVVMFFPIIGFQMVTANFFQSIGMASKAIFLSLTRQMVVLLPCLIILPRFFGAAGVWYSMPISDLLASLIAAAMLTWQFRKFKAQAQGA